MHSLLLLTQEQSRDEDYALVQLNLQADVAEEFPVVSLRLSVDTLEWYVPTYNEPFQRRSYLNLPTESPLSEGGKFAKMTTSLSANIQKIDIGYTDDNGRQWGAATSTETGVADTYFALFKMGPDTEVACMLQNGFSSTNELGIADLYLNIQNPGTNNPEYYRLRVQNTTGTTDVWTIAHVAASGTVTTLATVTYSVWDWDWIMFRHAGDTLSGWYGYYQYPDEDNPQPDGGTYGPWNPVISVTDTTIVEEGYVGFGANAKAGIHGFFAGDAYTDKRDEAEIYVNLSVRSIEGIPGQPVTFTFENVDEWSYAQNVTSPVPLHYAISTAHATDGDTSLKVRYETEYPVDAFWLWWRDPINGGSTTTTYWLSYTFYIESWAQIYKNGLSPNGGFWLPDMMPDDGQLYGNGPYVQATNATTGQIGMAGTYQNVSAGAWHSVIFGMSDDGATRHRELWIDNSLVKSIDDASNPTASLPYGIIIANENRTGGTVWIDQMKWSFGTKPAAPSLTETASGVTTQQWARVREKASGLVAQVGVEIDPTYSNTVTEAWVYTEIYIPQDMIDNIANNDSRTIFRGDDWLQLMVRAGFGSPRLESLQAYVDGSVTSPVILDSNFVGDRWIRFEYHHIVGTSQVEIWVDGNLTVVPLNMTYPSYLRPQGFNTFYVDNPYFIDTTRYGVDWVGADNMAYSTRGHPTDQQYDQWWTFEGADALNVANTNYPDPPFYANFGPGGDATTLEEGMQGGGPGLPPTTAYVTLTPSATEVVSLTTIGEVYLNLTAVSGGTYVDDSVVTTIAFSVLGGECFSTFSADQFGEGETSLRWYGLDNLRWSGVDNMRWTGVPALSDKVHC